jgi:hypothetical protein
LDEQLIRALYATKNSLENLVRQHSYSQQTMQDLIQHMQETNVLLQEIVAELRARYVENK